MNAAIGLNRKIFLIGLAILAMFSQELHAQSLVIPEKERMYADSLLRAANRLSDSAWILVYPKILEEITVGRPFVPWADFPDDLIHSNIPAFPGAEGGGAYTPGGRGGKVFVVTTLADSGQGSFREACEAGGARLIVFNTAGIIQLKSPVIVHAPYITIAGQTAPGDGVCLAGESVWIDTHDVVIRHMRFHRGDTSIGRRDNPLGGKPIGNIILDHVSVSWGLDEWHHYPYRSGRWLS